MRRLGIVLVLFALNIASAIAEDLVRDALRSGGHVLLMRHALAPGTGDPAAFDLKDVSTQRNLSEAGREQARTVGKGLKEAGILNPQVFSSQWNRCVETAALLDLGEVRATLALNSFFANRAMEAEISEAAAGLIRDHLKDDVTLVIVTHQVNITALTGIVPTSGEIVVVRPDEDKLVEVGRIRP